MKDKQELRAYYTKLRAFLQSEEGDGRILRHLRESAFWKEKRFFVYLSFRTEVGTMSVIEALRREDRQVCFPRVEGKAMSAVADAGRWEDGPFGTRQPPWGEDLPCDVALVPLLAFDGEGCRLGYGGGYYDRYFAAHPQTLRVGLAYDGQAHAVPLPREETDVPLDAVVTPSGVRFFENKRR